MELIITDQRSYRSEEPTDMEEARPLGSDDFPEMISQEAMEILDAARAYNNGNPPATIRSLDGSARGGIVVALAETFKLPIHAVGVGEQVGDLRPFDAQEFARGLVGADT